MPKKQNVADVIQIATAKRRRRAASLPKTDVISTTAKLIEFLREELKIPEIRAQAARKVLKQLGILRGLLKIK